MCLRVFPAFKSIHHSVPKYNIFDVFPTPTDKSILLIYLFNAVNLKKVIAKRYILKSPLNEHCPPSLTIAYLFFPLCSNFVGQHKYIYYNGVCTWDRIAKESLQKVVGTSSVTYSVCLSHGLWCRPIVLSGQVYGDSGTGVYFGSVVVLRFFSFLHTVSALHVSVSSAWLTSFSIILFPRFHLRIALWTWVPELETIRESILAFDGCWRI